MWPVGCYCGSDEQRIGAQDLWGAAVHFERPTFFVFTERGFESRRICSSFLAFLPGIGCVTIVKIIQNPPFKSFNCCISLAFSTSPKWRTSSFVTPKAMKILTCEDPLTETIIHRPQLVEQLVQTAMTGMGVLNAKCIYQQWPWPQVNVICRTCEVFPLNTESKILVWLVPWWNTHWLYVYIYIHNRGKLSALHLRHDVSSASFTRHSMAKVIYARLFDWLVWRINESDWTSQVFCIQGWQFSSLRGSTCACWKH